MATLCRGSDVISIRVRSSVQVLHSAAEQRRSSILWFCDYVTHRMLCAIGSKCICIVHVTFIVVTTVAFGGEFCRR
jgi:hypothetical protein